MNGSPGGGASRSGRTSPKLDDAPGVQPLALNHPPFAVAQLGAERAGNRVALGLRGNRGHDRLLIVKSQSSLDLHVPKSHHRALGRRHGGRFAKGLDSHDARQERLALHPVLAKEDVGRWIETDLRRHAAFWAWLNRVDKRPQGPAGSNRRRGFGSARQLAKLRGIKHSLEAAVGNQHFALGQARKQLLVQMLAPFVGRHELHVQLALDHAHVVGLGRHAHAGPSLPVNARGGAIGPLAAIPTDELGQHVVRGRIVAQTVAAKTPGETAEGHEMLQRIGPREAHQIDGPRDFSQKRAVDLGPFLGFEPIGMTVARPVQDPADRAIGRADFVEQPGSAPRGRPDRSSDRRPLRRSAAKRRRLASISRSRW